MNTNQEEMNMDMITCNGKDCEKTSKRIRPLTYHPWSRTDAYGLYTGLYCDKCYDDPTQYRYRKDRYPHDEPLDEPE